MSAAPSPSGPRLRVGIVGAGVAGAAIGAAFARAGHRVIAASAVSDGSTARIQRVLPATLLVEDIHVCLDVDLVLLAVPGDVLAGLVAGLAAAGAFHPGQILVHLDGALGIAALEGAAGCDVLPVALHPSVVLTGGPEDQERLAGAMFAVTTLRSLRPLGEALVLDLGGEPAWVEEEDRPAYAAALAAVHDQLAATLSAAAAVLRECGIPNPRAALAPVVAGTVERTLRSGSVAPRPGFDPPAGPAETADPEETP